MAYQAQREAELAEEMKHLSEPQQSISWGSYVVYETPTTFGWSERIRHHRSHPGKAPL